MNKEIIECLIVEKLREIWDICRQYDPDGDYLSMCIFDKEEGFTVSANNGADSDKPIGVFYDGETGEIYHSDLRKVAKAGVDYDD